MTKTIAKCFLLLVVIASASWGLSTGSARSNVESQNVTVSIQSVSCDQKGKVTLDWLITNSGKTPVHVYATFLKGPTASLDFNESSHLLTIWTSLSSEATFGVNAYPQAKFVKVMPGAVLRGRFTDSPKRNPPIKGVTQIAFAVAFGQSVESVQTRLRGGNYIHPANPIVQWQQIAKSAPAPLDCPAFK